MKKALFLALALISPQAAFAADIAPDSQPWGGMVKEESPESRSAEARKILEAARRLEARSAGMEFEETPDEKALREYLRGMAKRSGIMMDSGHGKVEIIKEIRKEKETLDNRPIPAKEIREKTVRKASSGDLFNMDNGKELVIRSGKVIRPESEPGPEIEIIESGGVSDEEWTSREQKQINDIVQTRKARTPFKMKNGDNVEIFVYPFNDDSMYFWKDLRANEDANRLIEEGKIRVRVIHERFEDSGAAIVWAWLMEKDEKLANSFLDGIADLPQGHLFSGNGDMPEKVAALIKKAGFSLEDISSQERKFRKAAALRFQEDSAHYRKLGGDFTKFPAVWVNGKAQPNYFIKIETRR